LNDVLDFSKMEAGKMTLESIPFHPHQVIQDGIQLLAVSAWQKGIEVACYLSPDVPECLLGDAMRLRQVVLNLLGNAIKFTARGYVEVRMEMVPNDLSRWQIRVIDTEGKTTNDLRVLFASGQQYYPPVRRNGPRSIDLDGAGAPDEWTHQCTKRSKRRK
jgi:signal transduction histidine kinase